MLLVPEVKQSPHLFVAPENDMASSATIATIRPTLGHVLFSSEMHRTCTSVSGAAIQSDVIDKVGIRHDLILTKKMTKVVIFNHL